MRVSIRCSGMGSQLPLLPLQQLLLLLLLFAAGGESLKFLTPVGGNNADTADSRSLAESATADTDVYTIRSDTSCAFTIVASTGATACTTTEVKLQPPGGMLTTVQLRLSSQLNYETRTTYACQVVCTPTAGTARTATITIQLTNVNDVTPATTSTLIRSTVNEEQAPNTAVVNSATSAAVVVTFTDAEVAGSGDVLTCSLSGSGSELLNVVTTATAGGCTCAVFTKLKIDRDTLSADDFPTILLKATDSGGLVGSATLSVSIADINDNAPSCTVTSYSPSVDEDTASATLATIATCTDADKGVNADLTFALVGTPAGYSLAGNVLSLTAAKDYDTMTVNPELVYVTVTDDSAGTKLSITTTVSVSFKPVNDNPPILTTASLTATAPESAGVGTPVFLPTATDGDKAGDPDSTLTWSIVSAKSTAGTNVGINLATSFAINSATGVVSVGTGGFDYESWTGADVVIKVTDAGTNPSAKEATQTLTLTVTDVNELPPTFTPSSSYRVSLAENNRENHTVMNSFLVSDPDGSGLPVWCEIISGNTDSVFRFNATNRDVLELAKTIEPDSATNHPLIFQLKVLCKDNNGTSPSLSSTATIQVDITTSNDVAPNVAGTSGCPAATPCSEATTLPGATVATLSVSDNDVGTDGEYDCSIVSPAGAPFTLQGCTAVTLSGTLDREVTNRYRLVVQAKDRGSPARIGTTAIDIYIDDVDDNPPYCLSYDYDFTVIENAAGNANVGTINCLDRDQAGVTYTLVPATVPFTITGGASSATLRVKNPSTLDYESTTSYTFNVRTTDTGSLGRTTDAVVRVTIAPFNEQPPTFANTAISVPEDQAPGSVVTTFAAADSDTGGHGIVSYAIQSATNSGNTFFGVSNTGQVTLIKGLDYETTTSYELTITATDGGGLVGTGTLTVNVGDKNDNSPVCAHTQVSLEMDENALASTAATGTQPSATDADSAALFGKIKYSIASGDTGSYFSIDAATGTIRRSATSGLSYESLTPPYNFYNLTVYAIDQDGLGPNTATCSVKLTIKDVEEGAPVFSPSVASATALAETTAVGTVVYTPTYTHVDKWDRPTFTLNPTNNKFSVDATNGKVTLAAALDYETATEHVLRIVATDKNSQSTTMTLTVPVTNSNEFSPVCTPGGTTVYIDENDQSSPSFPKNVMSFTCTDGDAGTTLLYTVTHVDGVVGTGSYQFIASQMRTTAALNYETNTNDIVVINISDQGPGTANVLTVTVTVSVNPVNEYAPVFTASSLTTTIDESTPVGNEVATLLATDTDTGLDHGTIKFAITGGNDKGYFVAAEATGKVTVARALDREDAASYLLTVTATDGPGLSVTATLTVSLNDVNDNSPVFTRTVYSVTVKENAAVGSTILSFTGKVSDADATSPFNTVVLSIETASVPFTLDASNRDLRIGSALNAATNPSYTLVIRAKDNNAAAVAVTKSTDIQVIVNVEEVNTVAPTFSGTGTVSVAEGTAVGSLISTAAATDPDSGLSGTVSYSIGTGNTNGDFLIGTASGRVTLKNALDFDAGTKVYYLGIVATDSGTPPARTTWTLTVSVTDINDNRPIWAASNTYSLSVPEDVTGLPKTVYTPTVTDPDTGVNGDIVFSLVSQASLAPPGGSSNLFAIDASTGGIRLLTQPDRELAASYEVVVRASDKATPALHRDERFVIAISDANDNTPTFGLCPKEITVAEGTTGGVLLATIAATDKDIGGNGAVGTYALTSADGGASSPSGLFVVSATGGISTAAGMSSTALDRETKSVYQFYITAADNGSPTRLTGSCLLNVSLTDKNDNPPVVGGQPIIASVSEAAPGGTIVYTFSTTDADIGTNAALLYEITDFTPANNFTVNNNGQISLYSSQRLDRERHNMYNLTVVVKDQGTDPGQMMATVTVSINIGDVNDNTPAFASGSISRSVAENSPVGFDVGTAVAATDPDLGENASLTYQLAAILVPTAGGDFFSVQPLTGLIEVKQAVLDRETRDLYVLRMVAIDNGSPARTGTTTVTVTITDVNDNAPVFTGTYTTGVSVNENSAVGTAVFTFVARDADLGANADVVYAIDTARLNGSLVNTFFQISATTGQLTVKAAIDREVHSQLQFYVMAEDKGATVLTTSASVNIFINDVNDNTPVFSPTFYNTEMYYKEERTSITLTTVGATDADATGSSVLYNWGTSSANFVLNPSTGTVSPGAVQATSKDSLYVQYVTATDAGSPAQTGTATLRVDTYDVNDVAVCVTYGTLLTTFLAKISDVQTALATSLNFKYPTARCGTWRYTSASTTVRACHYCVQDNSTDNVANIAAPKAFVPQSDLLTFWRLNSDGDPTAMLQSANFATTPVTLVEGYSDTTTATTTTVWYQTPWGIAVLVLSSVLAASLIGLAIGGLVHYLNNRSPSVKISQPKQVPAGPKEHPKPPPRVKANNNKNVYRDAKLWRGTPEFGRNFDRSPGELQRTGHSPSNSRTPTPVS